MASVIEAHRGRVVDSPGDNLLAEFASVLNATQCAVEIQEALERQNARLPENRKMNFRIGINLGDVIQDGSRIYGDGVNIAARLEGLAEAGGICISGSVYDQVKKSLTYHSVGLIYSSELKDSKHYYTSKAFFFPLCERAVHSSVSRPFH